jgi:transposase
MATTYEKSFKEEAVRLSDEVGAKQAANQLGIPYWTLADWRAARKARGDEAFVGSGHKQLPTDEKERRILELEKENSELKRANEILKDALGFFAESRRK